MASASEMNDFSVVDAMSGLCLDGVPSNALLEIYPSASDAVLCALSSGGYWVPVKDTDGEALKAFGTYVAHVFVR